MGERSWTSRLPGAYDVVMAPIEALGMGRLRARLWDELPVHGRGLEIGSGSGASESLRGERTGLVGTDISHALLMRSRRRGVKHPPLLVSDVHDLPFADGAFDWIVGSLLFCEVRDPVRGLREASRVLRPGGTLHLLEHVRPRGALGHAADALTRLTGPLLGEHFDRRTEQRVAEAGLTIERADRHLRGGLVHLIARRDRQEGR